MRIYMLLFLCCAFLSCATIHPVHTDNVRSFARSARALALSPGELYQSIADYRHRLKQIEASTIYTADKIVPRLNTIINIKRQFETNAEKVNQSALLIKSYAECLLALTDPAYVRNVNEQSRNLSFQLNAALGSYNKLFNKGISLSVGNFIGSVVNKIGTMKLQQLQKKYLKSFVDTGAVIINDVCDYFVGTVALSLENELASLDQQFSNVMTTFYDNVYEYQKLQNVNPFDYLKYYNPLYLDMKENLDGLHQLQASTITAMQHIKDAHEKLKVSVDVRLPGEVLAEIRDLYLSAVDVQTAYQRIKK